MTKNSKTAPSKRLSTVFDYSALRLHPDGRRVQHTQNLKRVKDIDHVPNTVLTRTGWIAADAGGRVGGYKRVKVRATEEETGEEFDLDEEGGGGEGKGKEREEGEEQEERPRKKKKKDVRTQRRREFLDDWSFLDGVDTYSQSQPSSRGISRHVTPGQSNAQDIPLPSSGLLKCIHHFASTYYTEQGQMLQISRQYRKEKKERRMKKLGVPPPTKSPKSKSKSKSRDGDDGSSSVSSSSSSEDEQDEQGENEEAKPKRKPAKVYRDMYKMFDGTALMAIGMLIQSHVESLLKPNVPEHWERDVRLTWGAPVPRARGAEGAHGEGDEDLETQTEWDRTVQKEREKREKAREYDDNEFYRSMLEGVDEVVRWKKIRPRKRKVVEQSGEDDEEKRAEGEGEGEGEGVEEGEREEGDLGGDVKGKGKAMKEKKKRKRKRKASALDGSPRKRGRKSKVVFKSAEIVGSSEEDEEGREGGDEPASANMGTSTVAATAAAQDESSEDEGREGDASASATTATSATQADPNVNDAGSNLASSSRPASQPIASSSAGSSNSLLPPPPTSSRTAPLADIVPPGDSANRQSASISSSSSSAEKRKRKRKEREGNSSRSAPLSSSPSPRTSVFQADDGRSELGAGEEEISTHTSPNQNPSAEQAAASSSSISPTASVPTRSSFGRDPVYSSAAEIASTSAEVSASLMQADGAGSAPRKKRKVVSAGGSTAPASSSSSATPATPARYVARNRRKQKTTSRQLSSVQDPAPPAGAGISSTSGEVSAAPILEAEMAEAVSTRKERKAAPTEESTSAPSASSNSAPTPQAGSGARNTRQRKGTVAEVGDVLVHGSATTTPADTEAGEETRTSAAAPASAASKGKKRKAPSAVESSLTSPTTAELGAEGVANIRLTKNRNKSEQAATSTPASSCTKLPTASVPTRSSAGRDSVPLSATGISSTSREVSVALMPEAEGDQNVPARKSRKVAFTGGSTPTPTTSRSSSTRNTRKQKTTQSATSRSGSALDTADVGRISARDSATEAVVAEETTSSVDVDGDRSRRKKRKSMSASVLGSKGVSQGAVGGDEGEMGEVKNGEAAPSVSQASRSAPENGVPTGGYSQNESVTSRPGSAQDTAEVGDASSSLSSAAPASIISKGKKRKSVADSVDVDGDRERRKKRKSVSSSVPGSKVVSQGVSEGDGAAIDVDVVGRGEEASGGTEDGPPARGNSQGRGDARHAHAEDVTESTGGRRALRARKTIKYTR